MLDRFVTQRKLTETDREQRTGDLPRIQREQTLRVVTRNSAATYFVWRGQLLGFEYELARRFAEQLGVRLEVVVAESPEQILPLLRDGRADVAAAFLTADNRSPNDGIVYSRPYHFAVKQVVTDAGDRSIGILDDLDERTFHVRRDSDYWHRRDDLQGREGLDITIEAVPAGEDPETTINKVADGEYDLTLVDDHIARNAAVWNDDVHATLQLGKPAAHRWAVRADNEQLLAAANRFLEQAYRGEFYNVVYAKYFRDRDRIRRYRARRVDLAGSHRLSPYDDLIKEHAERHGFDWRLLAAQMFEESGFNPQARSWAGAVGLMQVMPRTAAQVGIDGDLTQPDRNIEAGVRYLDWLRERFEEDLSVRDRTWFTLAAFNAGAGHVRDARRLAAELGLNPDRWFDNVEVAMRRLSERRYFRNARFGYVRGHEPVRYVQSIRERYQAYILWTNDCWPSCQPDPHPQVAEAAPRERALFSE
ncbi:MAG: transglycosylase SLT domain-containing protein [Halofilum sp. (in: g-proteobacteria)]|nr:transglycosylase SLT domain-containing protein [Halofilum sp. (in: g-proteobacteria)]